MTDKSKPKSTKTDKEDKKEYETLEEEKEVETPSAKRYAEFNKIKEMDSILRALENKNKLDERRADVYEFIQKSKYMVMTGFHNRKIILMFYDEVMEYFKEKTNNKNCVVVDDKIIYVSKRK